MVALSRHAVNACLYVIRVFSVLSFGVCSIRFTNGATLTPIHPAAADESSPTQSSWLHEPHALAVWLATGKHWLADEHTIGGRVGNPPLPYSDGRHRRDKQGGWAAHGRNGKQCASARAANDWEFLHMLSIFIPILTLPLSSTVRTLKSPTLHNHIANDYLLHWYNE
jgi:hypothetical protein